MWICLLSRRELIYEALDMIPVAFHEAIQSCSAIKDYKYQLQSLCLNERLVNIAHKTVNACIIINNVNVMISFCIISQIRLCLQFPPIRISCIPGSALNTFRPETFFKKMRASLTIKIYLNNSPILIRVPSYVKPRYKHASALYIVTQYPFCNA